MLKKVINKKSKIKISSKIAHRKANPLPQNIVKKTIIASKIRGKALYKNVMKGYGSDVESEFVNKSLPGIGAWDDL